ncbi:hypothetical protein DICVIV_14291 [Dictyocaulus viviparus]|uniref:Uncharacterized protein n=1 Tax=Dictyocaulus viviparus TaxID=29172 RepID=A0A0D8XBH5_DICVI|nr:hypothetical protein DICVIV_14291 [Dictyocaulus viviparus]
MSLQSSSSKGSHEVVCQAVSVVEENPNASETVVNKPASDGQVT